MELLNTLGIDWKLLVVQLINFGLLMAVLTYFLYKPLLRVLDERRERVRKSMEDAKAIENQRKEIEEFKMQQLKKIDQEMGQYLETAKKQAEGVKKDILANAQKEADQLLQKAKQQLGEERAKIVADLQGSVAKIVVRLSEKVLEREFKQDDQDRLLRSLEKAIPSLVK